MAVGSFLLKDAVTLDELEGLPRGGQAHSTMLTLNATLPHLPAVDLDASRARLVASGREVRLSVTEASILEQSKVVKLCDGADLLAVGDYDQQQRTVKPRVVLARQEAEQESPARGGG
jgi:tRNA U55 pseudouridine synthase TruB